MVVGNSRVNGIFEYLDSLTYTRSDIVICRGTKSNGDPIVRMFVAKCTVTGVNPMDDVNETYFEDYFKNAYSDSNILTKSAVLTYLRNIFHGVTENGVFSAEYISAQDLSSLNRSGIWRIAQTNEYVVVFISTGKSFMIIYDDNILKFRVGTNLNDGTVSWGEIKVIGGDVQNKISSYMTAINSLEILLRDRISQFDDLIEGISNN